MSDTAHVYRWRGPQGFNQAYDPPLAFFPRPFWVVLTVFGFIVWWPFGLALLLYSLGSRKMGCWSHDRFENKMQKYQWKMERMKNRMERRGFSFGQGFPGFGAPTSGNRAFDEYRMETLRRLEDEQEEFKSFLDRLRHAKDKEEFDAFMAQQRGARPTPPSDQPQG